MGVNGRQPARLAQLYGAWGGDPERMRDAPPTLVFAVLGQARADGKLTPEDESRALGNLLTYWAVKSALTASADCSTRPRKLTVRAALAGNPNSNRHLAGGSDEHQPQGYSYTFVRG